MPSTQTPTTNRSSSSSAKRSRPPVARRKPSPRYARPVRPTRVIHAHRSISGSCSSSWVKRTKHARHSPSSLLSPRAAMTDKSRLPNSISMPSTRGGVQLRRLVPLVALLSLPAATLAGQTQRAAYEELQTFSGVLNHIRLNYPDSVGYSELVAAAIRRVLRALDTHSHYESRLEWQRQNALERSEE